MHLISHFIQCTDRNNNNHFLAYLADRVVGVHCAGDNDNDCANPGFHRVKNK